MVQSNKLTEGLPSCDEIKMNDKRELLTPEKLYGELDYFNERAPEEMANWDPPTCVATYTSTRWDVTMQIPFNPQWGMPTHRLAPYYEDTDRLIFGPITEGEGGGIRWRQSVSFEPPKDLATRVAELNQEIAEDTSGCPPIANMQLTKIGNIDVLAYEEGCGLPQRIVEIAGTRHRYRFSGVDAYAPDFAVIVRTLTEE